MEPIPACDLETASGKLPLHEVPTSLIRGAAKAFREGNRTRPPLSWRNRPATSRYFGSLLRHLMDWWDGNEVDEKSGLPPLDHAAANLAVLMEIEAGLCHEPTDDRPCMLDFVSRDNEEGEGDGSLAKGRPE